MRNKTLIDENGKMVNMFGVEFSEAEKKRLESLVNSSNRGIRNKERKDAITLHKVAGVATGETVKQFKDRIKNTVVPREKPFAEVTKSKSLHQFKTRESYESYIRNLERVTDRGFRTRKTNIYKDNYVESLKQAYGDNDRTQKIIKEVYKMSNKKFNSLSREDEVISINFNYTSEANSENLSKIETVFNVIPDDDYFDEEFEYYE
jgi:hypothetical protein